MDAVITRLIQKLMRLPLGWRIILVGVPTAMIVISAAVYNASFHIVSTTPSPGSFPDLSPILYIDFNRTIEKQGISVTITGIANPSHAVSGKRLTVHLNSLLGSGQSYTLHLSHIVSTEHEQLGDQIIKLYVQHIPYNQLPQDIQGFILSQQDVTQPVDRNSIPISGTEALINNGLSTFQLDAFKQALFLFGQSAKITITDAVVDESNIVPFLPAQNDPTRQFTLTFKITINRSPYGAKLLYTGINTIRLLLSNTSGAQIYDSGIIDDSSVQ